MTIRGQLGEAEILRCRRKARGTGVGRTEGWPGSVPPGGHYSGTRGGRACSRAQRAATGADRAGSREQSGPQGILTTPPSRAGPPQRPVTRPAGKRRDKSRKETGGKGSAAAAPGEASAGRPSGTFQDGLHCRQSSGARNARHGSNATQCMAPPRLRVRGGARPCRGLTAAGAEPLRRPTALVGNTAGSVQPGPFRHRGRFGTAECCWKQYHRLENISQIIESNL